MTASKDSVLHVRGLSVRFAGHPVDVVDAVSLDVAAGETLAVVGESGCGKSVTAMALMGLLPAHAEMHAEAADFLGAPLPQSDARRWRDLRGGRLAMIFQEPMTALNPVFTIGDQIAESVIRHQGLDARTARRRARDLLDTVRVPDAARRLDAYPHELSGGLRQRVVIAMALANDPALIIADEPTTALDVTIQAQILALIATLQRETGAAMILITHDLGVVAEVADTVAVMYAGQIVERGPVASLFDDPQHPYTIGLMGAMPASGARGERLATIAGRVPTPSEMPAGCRFAGRCPFVVPACRAERPAGRVLAPGQVTPDQVMPDHVTPDHVAACIRAPLEARVTALA